MNSSKRLFFYLDFTTGPQALQIGSIACGSPLHAARMPTVRQSSTRAAPTSNQILAGQLGHADPIHPA
jgi:hypothetical protein